MMYLTFVLAAPVHNSADNQEVSSKWTSWLEVHCSLNRTAQFFLFSVILRF